jgi:hypothetical protein
VFKKGINNTLLGCFGYDDRFQSDEPHSGKEPVWRPGCTNPKHTSSTLTRDLPGGLRNAH